MSEANTSDGRDPDRMPIPSAPPPSYEETMRMSQNNRPPPMYGSTSTNTPTATSSSSSSSSSRPTPTCSSTARRNRNLYIIRAEPPAILEELGTEPVSLQCFHCGSLVKTKVTSECGMGAGLWSCICCICGCIYGCCLIPFFMDDCRVFHHHCPRCKNYIGRQAGACSME